MNTTEFCAFFERYFPKEEQAQTTPLFEQALTRSFFDPCFLVEGLTSVKIQQLLSMAYSYLPENEAYFEVGTYKGKTLISAMINNAARKTYACDNFSEFTANKEGSENVLQLNLHMFQLKDRVTFFNDDFSNIADKDHIPEPIGLYLYDGAHSEEMQYRGIKEVEHLLADEALILVDDWAVEDARLGTKRAIAESPNEWTQLYELPGHEELRQQVWWLGMGVFRFRRNESL
jgi:hypothetical protein